MRAFFATHHKKLLIAGAVLAVGFSLPHLAGASFFGDLAYTIVSKAAFGISYIIAYILGIAVALEAWAIEIILQISSGITQAPVVRLGFPITRYIANLGFVLAIVVIAIMTILRSQTYGMKQTLWKLVVAAILVNFSIVIAGSILNISDRITNTFLDGVNPAAEGLSRYSSFAGSLAGAFNPQKAFISSLEENPGGDTTLFGGGVVSEFGGLLTPLAGLLFAVFSILVIVITLGALVVMLLIRYVFIGLLLILMPLAWVAWIFPKMSELWGKWWHHFVRQVFFAPIVIFFLWLAIKTGEALSLNPDPHFAALSDTSSNIFEGFASLITKTFSPIVRQLLDASILAGITLGGIFVANSLSITGSKGAFAAAKGLAGGFGSWVGRRAVRGATTPLRRYGVAEKAAGLLGRIPRGQSRLARIGSGLAKYGLGWGARGVAALQAEGSEEQVKHYEAMVAKRTKEENKAALLNASMPERIAIYKHMAKNKQMDETDWNDALSEKTRDRFKQYGQGVSYKEDVEKATGVGIGVFANRTDIDAGKAAAAEYWAGIKKADISKMQLNDLFSGDAKGGLDKNELAMLSRYAAHGIATSNPELLPSILAQFKGTALRNFARVYEITVRGANLSREEQDKRLKHLRDSEANNLLGFSPTDTGVTPPPPGGTPPAGGGGTT